MYLHDIGVSVAESRHQAGMVRTGQVRDAPALETHEREGAQFSGGAVAGGRSSEGWRRGASARRENEGRGETPAVAAVNSAALVGRTAILAAEQELTQWQLSAFEVVPCS
jgi:hypothetical protein